MNNNMQDILKNYYASGGKTLFESDEQLAEAPYLDKNYIPVDIDDILAMGDEDGQYTWRGLPNPNYTPIIDPVKIQKLTKGATPVVKLDGDYYTFSSEDDKTVHVQMVKRAVGPGQSGEYNPQYLTKKKMPIMDFINKAREDTDRFGINQKPNLI